MNKTGIARYDAETRKWFKQHPTAVTTVARCEKCGLYYKPSLGHKPKDCKKEETQYDRF